MVRRAASSRTGTSMSMAANALQLARGLARMINTEIKYIDIAAAPTLSTTFTTNCLNVSSQGTTSVTRCGSSIRCKRTTINAWLTTGLTSVSLVRIILFIGKQPNGGTPSSFLTTNSVLSPLSPEKRTQFRILSDQTYTVDSVNKPVVAFAYDIPDDIHTEYLGNAGTYADISTNGIYMAYFAAVVTGANYPSLNYYSRVEFVDN